MEFLCQKTFSSPKKIPGSFKRKRLRFYTSEYQLVQPKTRRSKRNIVVHRIALSALKEYMDTQLKVKNYGGDIYLDEGFIFAKKK